jgi:hypothetical protein
MQIIIQKQFLILVQISENIYRVFLVVVNYVFDFIENSFEYIVEKVRNFIRNIFGFNIYKLNTLKIKSQNYQNINNFTKNKNEDFLRYSNLLAPPHK